MDNIKVLGIVGVLLILVLGIAWLLHNLGLGGGWGLGGGGGGIGTENGAASSTQPTPPVTEKDQVVLVSGNKATVNGQEITPEEIARRAKAGQTFIIQDKGDAIVRVMDEFKRIAKETDGRVIVKD